MQTSIKYAFVLVILIVVTTSCDLFKGKEKATNEAVQQELAEIDWNTVDELPSFPQCNGMAGQQSKICFENVVTQHMLTHLEKQQFEVSETISDTIFVNMIITAEGVVQFKKLELSNITLQELPTLEEIIKTSVTKLPKAMPAHKRGIPVSAKFVLPVFLNIE